MSIRAISKAKFVKCDGNAIPGDWDGDLCNHDAEIGHFLLGKEGLKRGCYIPGKKGREFSFEIGYGDYSRFFDELYRMVYGIDANGVYKAHRRYQGPHRAKHSSTLFGRNLAPKLSESRHRAVPGG